MTSLTLVFSQSASRVRIGEKKMELTEKQIALYFTDHRAPDHVDLFFLLFSSNQKLCMAPPSPPSYRTGQT